MQRRHENAGHPQTLSDLVPRDIFVGTSLILRQNGRLLYGCRPPFQEDSRQIVELTGIGGGMEDEDESLTAGVLREAHEEIDAGVRLLRCRETIVVYAPDRVERLALQGEERPAAVVFRHYHTPPRQPWHGDGRDEGCLVVFLAELESQPTPAMELPALIWLKPAHVIETARRDIPVHKLAESGAEMIQRTPAAVPEDAWARLTDAQEALVLALGNDVLAFYDRLANEHEV